MAQLAAKSESDLVRDYVWENAIKPAAQRGAKTAAVNVGAVHKALRLHNRVPLVCAALKSKKFLAKNNLRILSMTGPPSGQSTTVTFTYEILVTNAKPSSSANLLVGLRGIAKELFRKLGGGEAFIRKERTSFTDK